MKNPLILGTCALLATVSVCHAQQTNTVPPPVFSITHREANERTWQVTTYKISHSGEIVPHVHTYKELATGLCFLPAGQNGTNWMDSRELINVLPDGSASASEGRHQVFWPADLANGTIRLVTPDGLRLSSQPIGISYDNGTDTVLIAAITNSVGELVSSNQILYRDAILGGGVDADVLYTYRKSGFEQDIIFRTKPPAPERFGFDSANTKLQLITEFFNPPNPAQSAGPINPNEGLQDTTLAFGTMKMVQGKAFSAGETNWQGGLNQTRIYKSWISGERNLLIEQLPYQRVGPELAALQSGGGAMGSGGSILDRVSSKRLLPQARRLAQVSKNSIQVASVDFRRNPGVVLDYTLLDSGETNYTFDGSSTFYISGKCILDGTTVFEGGSVIKANSSGSIEIDEGGSVDCQTAPYRPCCFTSWNDNSIGGSVGGSGSPNFEDVTNFLNLQTTNTVTLHDLRFSYAENAVQQPGPPAPGQWLTFQDCQSENVAALVYGCNLAMYNVLIGDSSSEQSAITNHEVAQIYPLNSLIAENVTADSGYALIEDDNDIVPALTNCLITSEPIYSPAHGYAPAPSSNVVVWLPSVSAPVYKSANGGNYYLTNGSPYRAEGTANIDTNLLADLQQKTTYAPILYNGVTFSTNAIFNPWAPRDTNSLPDIGYAYNPLDYIFENNCQVYSNVTFTAGTAAAWTTGEGIQLENKVTVNFAGTVTSPDYWVRANTVQEDDSNGSYGSGGLVSEYSFGTLSAAPTAEASFTKYSMLAGYGNPFRDDGGELYINMKNCEFWDTGEGGYGVGLNLTNCLFYRTYIGVYSSGPAEMSMQNCTVYGGPIYIGHSGSWPDTFVNCSFDGGADLSGVDSVTYADYNAFPTNGSRFPTLGTNDVIVTNGFGWTNSWFGSFYLAANSPLVEAGSTNANYLGLYHFTTQADQVPDGTNIVTIGYHYVTTGQYGNPLDSNGDGIPDYLEDANGDGLFDGNELADWQISPYGLSQANAFEVFTPLKP